MPYKKLFFCLLFGGLILSPFISFAQITPKTTTTSAEDTTTRVEILPGVRKLEFRKENDSTQLQILAGNVRLRQGTTLFYCDSCVINNNSHIFEAWGHVHINDSDTADAYSNHLLYYTQKKVAYLDGNVKLTDGKGSLTTPDLEYDVETKVGIYKHGGTVINKKSVLTSQEGYYYTDLKDVYFKNKVELKDPAYYIKTDSLLYNTELETARFIAETFIKDSSGRTIETKEGSYNLKNGKAEFGQRPIVRDKNLFATGNEMRSDDSTGMVQMRGNAIIIDSANNTTILAGEVFINKKTNSFLAIKKPVMIIKQDNDSIYITADTLFSARLTDLYEKKDSVVKDTVVGTHVISLNEKNISLKDTTTEAQVISINQKDSLTLKDTLKRTNALIKNNDSANLKKAQAVSINEKPDTHFKDTVDRANAVTIDEKPARAGTEGDSTNRYFEAFSHVRIFSDSLQAVCDSLFYSFKDSIFRLYDDPVIWAKESQITGDTILLYTKNRNADRMKVFNNSFLVNNLDPEVFNQIKSSRMDAYFKDGSLDSVRASGLAECIYYIQDEDSAYTGINESKSDILDAYFKEKQLQKVIFRSAVSGTIWPIKQKDPKEMRLENFRWLEERRPKTKYELFE